MNEDIKGILIQDSVPTPNNPIRIRKLLVNKEAEEYITNLQKDIDNLDDFNRHLLNENKKLQKENEQLRTELNTLKMSEEEWLDATLGGDE